MNSKQRRLLNKMKKLIREGKKSFIDRSDRSYKEDLLEIGISEYEAWFVHIMYLQDINYFVDYKPDYYKSGESLVFKKNINKKLVYIKLKIENDKDNNEECVCLSFHIDRGRY